MINFIALNVFLIPVLCILFGISLGVYWRTSTPEKQENHQNRKSVKLPPFKR